MEKELPSLSHTLYVYFTISHMIFFIYSKKNSINSLLKSNFCSQTESIRERKKTNFPFNKIFKCFSGFYTSFAWKWANLINWILRLCAFDFSSELIFLSAIIIIYENSIICKKEPTEKWQDHYAIIFHTKTLHVCPSHTNDEWM